MKLLVKIIDQYFVPLLSYKMSSGQALYDAIHLCELLDILKYYVCNGQCITHFNWSKLDGYTNQHPYSPWCKNILKGYEKVFGFIKSCQLKNLISRGGTISSSGNWSWMQQNKFSSCYNLIRSFLCLAVIHCGWQQDPNLTGLQQSHL